MSTIRATFVQHGSSPVPNITLNASGQVIVASGIVSSGTFAAPSGSVSAPGLYFVGDSNTGIYSPSADTIAFTEGGVESVRIDSSGRVGIGTSSPTAPLDVAETSGSALRLRRVTSGNTVDVNFYNPIATAGDVARIRMDGDGISNTVGALSFWTTQTPGSLVERMRVNNSGGVLINTTTHRDSARLVVDGDGSSVNSVWYAPSTSSYSVLYFRNPNGNTGRIDLSGTTTSYVTTSDYRLKENIEPVTNGIARLQQLKPSRFNFIVDPDKTVDGFIAHEVQEVVPEAISGEKDAVDADGNPVYQGIDQSKLVPLLTAALQEAVAKIESLEARLTAAGI